MTTGTIPQGPAFAALARHGATDPTSALADLSGRANTALMQGDATGYAAIMQHTDDFTLMQPFGGKVVHGFDRSPAHLQALGAFFRNGDFGQEVIQCISAQDVAVLVVIEHQFVEVGGLPAQEWPLRVTLVFRREGGQWCLAHRHADPLVHGISVKAAAALARGDSGGKGPSLR